MQIVIVNGKGGSGKSTLAASLAQVMDADIIDHDNQGTLRITSAISGINKPVYLEKVTKPITIHDTPPYNSSLIKSLYNTATFILIPCNLSYADLVGVNKVIEDIRECKKEKVSFIVFNRVRKPHNKMYREIKDAFFNNYKDIKKAKTELSQLNGFLSIFSKPLKGAAFDETKELEKEILGYINIA